MQFQLWDFGTCNFTGTAADVGTVDARTMSEFAFSVTGLTGETVSVTASFDGSTFDTNKLRPINLNTGAVHSSSDLANGIYFFNVQPLGYLKFTKSSTSETITVRCGLGR